MTAELAEAARPARPNRLAGGRFDPLVVTIDLMVAAAVWAAVGWWWARAVAPAAEVAAAATAVALAWSATHGLHLRRPAPARVDEVWHLAVSAVAGGIAAAIVALVRDGRVEDVPAIATAVPVGTGGVAWVVGAIATWSITAVARGIRRELRSGRDAEAVVVVGEDAPRQFQLLLDHPECGFAPLGIVTDPARSLDAGLGAHHLGRPEDLLELMQRLGAECAVVASAAETTVDRLRSAGHRVVVATGAARLGGDRVRVRSVGHQPLLVIERPTGERRIERAIKQLAERTLAAVALVVVAPLLLVVAAAIRLDSPGPAIYRSTRVGKGAQGFEMLKFRSMSADADRRRQQLLDQNERNGPLFKMTADPRITRIGSVLRRTSIDELPQLVNVVRGDMSLVGPRPALPDEASQFDLELRERFNVLPGVTGLWQVEARNSPSFEAYRRLDLHYVENWSLLLDLRIVLATVVQVAVSLALVPARRLVSVDGVVTAAADPVIDLRERPEDPDDDVVRDPSVAREALRA